MGFSFRGPGRRAAFAFVVALVLLPLVATVIRLHGDRHSAPFFDVALMELRVRDVGSAHPPLVGLTGRLGTAESPTSHPGPLAFYLLWPVYRTLGGSSWALYAATAALHAAAACAALFIASRRAGRAGLIAVGIGLALLEVGFGPALLTQPWNPWLPVFWFVPFLLGVWAVASGDVVLLPLVAFSACLCAQTHLPYLAVCGGLGVFAFGLALLYWRRPAPGGSTRAQTARACFGTLILLGLLWAPPVVEELSHDPGNISRLVACFRHATEPLVGARAALDELLRHLDVVHLAGALLEPGRLRVAMPESAPDRARGALLIGAWAVSAMAGLRRRERSLLALHGVVGCTLVVSFFAISRIIGAPWSYLVYWAWSVGAFVAFAVAATAGTWLLRRSTLSARNALLLHGAGASLIVCCGVRLLLHEAGEDSSVRAAAQLAPLATNAVAAIRKGRGAASGATGRYFVEWRDAFHGGGQGFGLVNELERRGLTVGTDARFAAAVRPHRVMDPEQATARIVIVTGDHYVRAFRDRHGAVEVAHTDRRTAEERREFDELRGTVIQWLRKNGREDRLPDVDRFIPALAGSADPYFSVALNRMALIGGPAAVFILPAKRPPGKERARR